MKKENSQLKLKINQASKVTVPPLSKLSPDELNNISGGARITETVLY
jgi:hypothetical protein